MCTQLVWIYLHQRTFCCIDNEIDNTVVNQCCCSRDISGTVVRVDGLQTSAEANGLVRHRLRRGAAASEVEEMVHDRSNEWIKFIHYYLVLTKDKHSLGVITTDS